MKLLINYLSLWLAYKEAEQRMQEASDEAISELLNIKPEGGRIPLDDEYSIELALVPQHDLTRKRGWQAVLWRSYRWQRDRLMKQLSRTIQTMRELAESYAEEHDNYAPELQAVLKVITAKEKRTKKENIKE